MACSRSHRKRLVGFQSYSEVNSLDKMRPYKQKSELREGGAFWAEGTARTKALR